jgi:catechol-2,3-dioxygenase
MSDQQPERDLKNMPAPDEGLVMTHFLTVRDVARSRAFYADVLGGEVVWRRTPASSSWPTAGSS